MENRTKRMSKARWQGLATKKPAELGPPTRRLQLRGRGMELLDTPGEMRATERRDSLMSHRKAKRQARGITRAMTTSRVR